MMENNSSDSQSERDRNRRGNRPSRFTDAARDRSRDKFSGGTNRIYVSNIPYEYKWNEVKDIFRRHVGDVKYVELFNDEFDKPRGCGIVEFSSNESVKKAMEVMHRFPIQGRKLIIKEDMGDERDKCGHIIKSGKRDDDRPRLNRSNDNWQVGGNGPVDNPDTPFNTYGLSAQFLESINVRGPLHNKIFVANLDYKVDRPKLKEVFKMAGKVRNIDLSIDKEGNSRGFAIIEYDHPVEAVQAISMFDRQTLYDRKLIVRLDRIGEKSEIRLPEGLKGIGLGLGANGEPLYDVARHISQPPIGLNLCNQQAGILGAVPNNSLNMGAFGNNPIGGGSLGGNFNLNNLGLGILQQQQLQQQQLQQQQQQQQQQGVVNCDLPGNMNMVNMGNSMPDMSGGQNGLMGNGNRTNRSNLMMQNMGSYMQSNVNRQNESIGNMYGGQSSVVGNVNVMPFGMSQKDEMNMGNNKAMDTIKISNLPSTMTWQLLREKFSEVGDVKFAEKIGPDTALIRFHNERSAGRAINMFHRTRIDGRTIDVNYH